MFKTGDKVRRKTFRNNVIPPGVIGTISRVCDDDIAVQWQGYFEQRYVSPSLSFELIDHRPKSQKHWKHK